MKTFWVLEAIVDDRIFYYAGDLKVALDMDCVFKFGSKELAENFIERAAKSDDLSFNHFAKYIPVEYAQLYIKAEDLKYLDTYEG